MADTVYSTAATTGSVSVGGTISTSNTVPDNITPLDIDLLTNNPVLPPMDYTNLDFSSIKLQLLNLLKANANSFGYSLRDFADSNTAGMLLNLTAYLGQMLSYHADAMVNELFLDTSQTPWSTYKLLSMFGYKPARPKAGVILLAITRNASSNFNPTVRTLEDASEILVSNSLNRKKFSFGNENFELFPAITSNGTLVPDMLGDVIMPAYVSYENIQDPDYNIVQLQKNTIFCFGLTGTTISEDFVSDGTANQVFKLTTSYVNDSKITVQVQDTKTSTISGVTAYNVWTELSYLSLAGFRTATTVSNITTELPYLITSFKLSPELYALKQSGQLRIGTVLELDYNNILNYARYQDFKDLSVSYQTCLLSDLVSSSYVDPQYVDVLLYHPAYVYGDSAQTIAYSHTQVALTNYVLTDTGDAIYWSANEILYLLDGSVTVTINGITYSQPQIVSDTQIALAGSKYSDIIKLRNNPELKVAIGRAISNNTLAFGISADFSTYIESDTVYETTWDSNFNVSIRFGDGIFGQIPPKGSAIKIIYRVNDAQTTGNVVSVGQANQTSTVGSVDLLIRNDYESSPATGGEDISVSKTLISRYLSSQDRAVIGTDYTILAKRFNSAYKVSTALVKSDSDSSIVRLYTLIHRTGNSVETIEPLNLMEKLQLYTYLNDYKCYGVSLEISDGTIRLLDLRIDVRIRPGFLTGQVKSDISSVVNNFFNLSSAEMGVGFNSTDLIKTVASVSGIDTCDFYFGGLETLTLASGNTIKLGNKVYQQIKDIPSYNENMASFPNIGNSLSGLGEVTQQVGPYEILILNTLTINTATQ